MFLEKFHTPGLAHLSYIIGAGGSAAVIDPRRDTAIYEEAAAAREASITHIFETHRNEDYVIGSVNLARRTGATIHHGQALDFGYGQPVKEGDLFELGGLKIEILETPGHTYESISLVLYDPDFGQQPVAVFTGDALFIGDVGRTDFFPDRAREVAGLLYDSVFEKLLPLGDHVLLYPAHGAGSVCGSGMADREFSSLGYERLTNPALRETEREAFIDMKVNEKHYLPPYFQKMEEFNQSGAVPAMDRPPFPLALTPGEFESRMKDGLIALDVRSAEAFAGCLVPGSLAVPLDMVPTFAGWFLSYDRPVGLIANHLDEVEAAIRHLIRIGFDNVAGYLGGGLTSWEVSGRPYAQIPAVHAEELVRRIQAEEEFTLLDVRKDEEVSQGHLPGAKHIYIGHLPDRLDEVPRDRPVVTFCGSGQRAIIAASILRRNGFTRVENSLGSMAACRAVGCDIVQPG
jgi:hydroxyacylglutathione hydrolase